MMPSEAGEASQQIGAPMIAGLTGTIHASITRLTRTISLRENAIEVRTLGSLSHTILWNLCRLNSDGQTKRS